MSNLVRKFLSRKFLAALAGVVSGLVLVFKLDEGVVNTVAGAVTAAASVVSYMIAESSVDAAAAKKEEK